MLIRTATDDLIEYPDELGALVLADESQHDGEPTLLEDVNLLVNVVLGLLYDAKRTLAENIAHAKNDLTRWGTPSEAAMQKALAQIKTYNEEIPVSQIGYINHAQIDYYFVTNPKNKGKPLTIDQDLHEIGTVPALTGAVTTLPTAKE